MGPDCGTLKEEMGPDYETLKEEMRPDFGTLKEEMGPDCGTLMLWLILCSIAVGLDCYRHSDILHDIKSSGLT